MVNISLIPTWGEVAGAYPYAPGRGDLSKDEWKTLRDKEIEEREARRKMLNDSRKALKESAEEFKKYEADWDKAETENAGGDMLTDRFQLPNRNIKTYHEKLHNTNKLDDPMATVEYITSAVDRPQNPLEFGLSWAAGTGESVGEYIAGLFGFGPEAEKKDTPLKDWMETYIASGGGSGGAGLDSISATQTAYAEFNDQGTDWDGLKKAFARVKEPDYREAAFNPQLVMANMLMNADWVNQDMSKAGAVMQKAFDARAKNNADAWNARESDRYEKEKWEVLRDINIEEMKARDAFRQAQLALAKWEAQQPKALGGNRISWRDSSGNLHFQQIDKAGEARTVGTNAAMIEMLDGDLEGMTPKKILQRANAAAMLYPDKDKIPFIQGYIMQATAMLPQKED